MRARPTDANEECVRKFSPCPSKLSRALLSRRGAKLVYESPKPGKQYHEESDGY